MVFFKDGKKSSPTPLKGKARNLETGLSERQKDKMAICKSYIKNPEALRFQKELFARTFGKNYTIMGRIMQCVCQEKEADPAWLVEMKERAKLLVNAWKSKMIEMFEVAKAKSKRIDPRQWLLKLFPQPEKKGYWKDIFSSTPKKTKKKNSDKANHKKKQDL